MPHGHAPVSSSGRRHTPVTVTRHREVGAAPTQGLWAALSSAYDSGPSCISPTRSSLHSKFQLQESPMPRSSDRQLPGTSPAPPPQPTSPIPAEPGYRHRRYGMGEAETAVGLRSCNGKLRQAQSAPMDVQPGLQWRGKRGDEKGERTAVCRHQEREDNDSEEEKDGLTPAAVACRGGCARGGGEEEEERLPPHELVAREWASATSYGGTAFSVCQGVGRTLKGRDLCRVRNAILKQTGFI